MLKSASEISRMIIDPSRFSRKTNNPRFATFGNADLLLMKYKFKVLSRSNLYARFLIILILDTLVFILASESDFIFGNEVLGPRYGGMIVGVLNLFFFFYAIRICELLEQPKWLTKILWCYFLVGFVIIFYMVNPFYDVVPDNLRATVYSVLHALNFILYSYLISVFLKDIFGDPDTHSDHIWGAVCVYFLAIMAFGDVYEIITLMNPGLFGELYEPGLPNWTHSVTFSVNSMAGVDLFYSDAGSILKKIGAFQNILANLFLVVILGRLLSHPLKKRED